LIGSTINRRRAAIGDAHKLEDLEPSFSVEAVRAMPRLRRRRRRLAAITATMAAAQKNTLIGVRDRTPFSSASLQTCFASLRSRARRTPAECLELLTSWRHRSARTAGYGRACRLLPFVAFLARAEPPKANRRAVEKRVGDGA
jgi:hypothetical protein